MTRSQLILCLTMIVGVVPPPLAAQSSQEVEDALTVGIAALHANDAGRRQASLQARDSVVPRDVVERAAGRLGYGRTNRTGTIPLERVVYVVTSKKLVGEELTFDVNALYIKGKDHYLVTKSVSLARRGYAWVVTRKRNRAVS